jgi:hypothetical protein
VGWDSIVHIATHHGLDVLGIEFWWGWNFCIHPDWPWGPPRLLYMGYWVFFLGVNRPWNDADHTTPPSAEVKESVELCLYCPYGSSWPVIWWKGK